MGQGKRAYGVGTFTVRLVGQTIRGYADDGGGMIAGAIAYRVLFSVFPLVIVLTALLGVVIRATGVQADVIDVVVKNVPLTGRGQDNLRVLLQGATGGTSTLGFIAILGLLWSASGMMGAIRYALNRAWDVTDTRPFLRGKLVDVLVVLGVGLLMLLSLGLSIGAQLVTAYASTVLDRIGAGAGALTWLVGFLLPAALAASAVASLYRVVPATAARPPFRAILPSAAVVGLAFAALQVLFGVYLSHFGNYNAVYGSLGAVIAFLVFVYLAATLFLLGAQAAAAVPRVRATLDRGEGLDERGPPLRTQVARFLRGLVVDTRGRGERRRPSGGDP